MKPWTNKKPRSLEAMGLPSTEIIEGEIKREKYRHRYSRTVQSTVFTLVTVAAAAILAATLFLPVLRIYGTSMEPSLTEGNIVFSVKSSSGLQRGDVIAFYFNNKVLVKRVIAFPGEWVDIDRDGQVSINQQQIDEPYLTERALGDCNIELPYQVPDGKVFVMGDYRSTSVDSRNAAVGCIADEQLVGKLVFCIWPLTSFGAIK